MRSKKLSNELLPSVQLSNAQTIDRMTSIVKNSLNQFTTRELNVDKKKINSEKHQTQLK